MPLPETWQFITVALPAELVERLDEIGAGRTRRGGGVRSELVRQAITDWLDGREPDQEADRGQTASA
jgi:metal-responsive CopG/Arc/MetJ family transcriptional regulator